ncbi:MAG: hypothetical protein OXJ64_04280, partial [Boseongicola sp.]|nr:hypothetical protein [Boseongicola sp.]
MRDVANSCLDDLQASDKPAGTGLRLATMADIPALIEITEWATRQTDREGLFLRMSKALLTDFVRDGIVLLPFLDSKILGYSNA